MTMDRHDNHETDALAALTSLGRDVVAPPDPADLDRGLNSLYARISVGKARRHGVVRWSLVGATVTVALLLVFQGKRFFPGPAPTSSPPMLSYRISGGEVLEAGYLRESGNGGIRLSFNEGSEISLVAGSRGRLRSVEKDGARIAIENGTARFQVTPSTHRRWRVEAGPFLVTVTGTVFTLAWDPSSEVFDLKLKSGRVVVSGPVSGGDVALRAGQRLEVRLAKAQTIISEDHESAGAPMPTEAPAAPSSPPGAQSPAAARSKASSALPLAPVKATPPPLEGGRRWARDLARGDWDRILLDVDRAGVERTIETASSDELFVVASAARYRHRAELAHSALLAVRRRFPDSPRALDALFLLGRVEEAREHGSTRAIGWYDEYLARVSAGDYAAEALGRKMILTREHGGTEKARPIADEYLRRFPKGSYAGSARALQKIP